MDQSCVIIFPYSFYVCDTCPQRIPGSPRFWSYSHSFTLILHTSSQIVTFPTSSSVPIVSRKFGSSSCSSQPVADAMWPTSKRDWRRIESTWPATRYSYGYRNDSRLREAGHDAENTEQEGSKSPRTTQNSSYSQEQLSYTGATHWPQHGAKLWRSSNEKTK